MRDCEQTRSCSGTKNGWWLSTGPNYPYILTSGSSFFKQNTKRTWRQASSRLYFVSFILHLPQHPASFQCRIIITCTIRGKKYVPRHTWRYFSIGKQVFISASSTKELQFPPGQSTGDPQCLVSSVCYPAWRHMQQRCSNQSQQPHQQQQRRRPWDLIFNRGVSGQRTHLPDDSELLRRTFDSSLLTQLLQVTYVASISFIEFPRALSLSWSRKNGNPVQIRVPIRWTGISSSKVAIKLFRSKTSWA